MAVGELELVQSNLLSSASSLNTGVIFNDLYQDYVVNLSNIDDTADRSMSMRVITGGSPDTGSNYEYAVIDMADERGDLNPTGTSQTNFGDKIVSEIPDVPFSGGNHLRINSPAISTQYTYIIVSHTFTQTYPLIRHRRGYGVYKQANVVTGLEFQFSASTTGTKIDIYGLRVT